MAYLIKRLLQTASEELFLNTNSDKDEVVAKNITLLNTSASAVDVSLSFVKKDESFNIGAVLFEFPLAGKEYIEIQDRILLSDDTIYAYASVADVIALSIDVTGGRLTGRFEPALP